MPLKKSKSKPSFEVVSGLAQELIAPLNSLSKTTSKILNEYQHRDFEYISFKDFKSLLATIELMDRQLKKLSQTSAGMLRLCQTTSSSGELSDLNAIIGEVVQLFAQQLQQGRIKVKARLDAKLPFVHLGRVECHQVVHNLLVNAIQAMPAGGVVDIKTTYVPSSKKAHLLIKDNGVGIAPEYLPKVFEPFFTTKARGVEKSSGLGLSTVHAIIQSCGGDIEIQSSLRQGTAVSLNLPIVSAS